MPKKKVTEAVKRPLRKPSLLKRPLHRCHAVRVVRIFLN